jgi:hypothetical protein
MGKIAKAQDRSIAALVRSAESNAILAVKFESLTDQMSGLTAKFDRVVEILFASSPVPLAIASAASAAGTPTPAGKDDSQRNKGASKPKARVPTPRPDSNAGG